MDTTTIAETMVTLAAQRARRLIDLNVMLADAGSRRSFAFRNAPAVVMADDGSFLVQIARAYGEMETAENLTRDQAIAHAAHALTETTTKLATDQIRFDAEIVKIG